MARNTSVTLGERYDNFTDEQVRTGRYNSVSEVVRAGLRLLEDREAKLGALREALIVGEQSGRSERSYKEIFRSLKQG
ncbi:MAG: type II toxin-antitoxin system ParD family antitoxin [Alphaproteobacteria bacterium]|nr:type II toxin-antitoxin system ParD family antitoxin [Alphaproteobacteria bacterium]